MVSLKKVGICAFMFYAISFGVRFSIQFLPLTFIGVEHELVDNYTEFNSVPVEPKFSFSTLDVYLWEMNSTDYDVNCSGRLTERENNLGMFNNAIVLNISGVNNNTDDANKINNISVVGNHADFNYSFPLGDVEEPILRLQIERCGDFSLGENYSSVIFLKMDYVGQYNESNVGRYEINYLFDANLTFYNESSEEYFYLNETKCVDNETMTFRRDFIVSNMTAEPTQNVSRNLYNDFKIAFFDSGASFLQTPFSIGNILVGNLLFYSNTSVENITYIEYLVKGAIENPDNYHINEGVHSNLSEVLYSDWKVRIETVRFIGDYNNKRVNFFVNESFRLELLQDISPSPSLEFRYTSIWGQTALEYKLYVNGTRKSFIIYGNATVPIEIVDYITQKEENMWISILYSYSVTIDTYSHIQTTENVDLSRDGKDEIINYVIYAKFTHPKIVRADYSLLFAIPNSPLMTLNGIYINNNLLWTEENLTTRYGYFTNNWLLFPLTIIENTEVFINVSTTYSYSLNKTHNLYLEDRKYDEGIRKRVYNVISSSPTDGYEFGNLFIYETNISADHVRYVSSHNGNEVSYEVGNKSVSTMIWINGLSASENDEIYCKYNANSSIKVICFDDMGFRLLDVSVQLWRTGIGVSEWSGSTGLNGEVLFTTLPQDRYDLLVEYYGQVLSFSTFVLEEDEQYVLELFTFVPSPFRYAIMIGIAGGLVYGIYNIVLHFKKPKEIPEKLAKEEGKKIKKGKIGKKSARSGV